MTFTGLGYVKELSSKCNNVLQKIIVTWTICCSKNPIPDIEHWAIFDTTGYPSWKRGEMLFGWIEI